MKRILIAVAITMSLGASVFAQRGQRGPGGPAPELKTALGLTDAQAEAIKGLAEIERQRTQAIMTDIEQKREALDTLLDGASPSPLEVGSAAIALRASENRLGAERDLYIAEIKKQLTGEQQQKLDMLLAANGGRGLPIPGLGGPGGQRGGRR